MRAADENLRAAGGISDLKNVDLDPVALGENFGLDALIGGKHGFGKLAVGGDADGNASVSRLDMRDDAGEDFMLFGGKLLIDYTALRLADALNNDLLCRLRGNAAELLRLNRYTDNIAGSCLAADLLRRGENDLMAGVLDLFNDGLFDEHIDLLLILVENDLYVILALGIILAESGEHRLLYLVVHIGSGDTLFFLDVLNGLKKFCVHVLTPFCC